jgi:VCBS repeat-containing protein
LNFAGKSGLHVAFGPSAQDHINGHIDSLSKGADTVTVPDAHLLFSGDYERSGTDLIVSDPLHRVVVPNYFHGDKRPTLVSPEGAPLDPKVIDALTGHVQYAQAGTAPAAKVVGHVVKMTGSASIVRNGVTIDVNNGDVVYQNDVVQTGSGSTLGLVMIDGTTFNMTANARLMMNDLTYDAASTSNTSLFTLVQGAATFVAGQVAKTGDMKVATPVATMGIRGTAVILDVNAVDGTVSVSVVNQRDGQVHAVQVFNARGDLIGTVTSNGSSLTLRPTASFEVIAQESNKTVAQVLTEFNAFQQLLSTYEIGKQLVPNTPAPTDGRRGDGTQQPLTKFAGSTISPIDSTTTKFNADIASTKDAKIDAGTDGAGTLKPTGDGAGLVTKVAVTIGDGPVQFVEVAATSIPFVVTPSPVSRISSGPGDHFGPVMSADGQFVTYDPDGAIYLFDRQTGATRTVAAPDEGFTYGSPTISSDGHFIVYQGSNGTQSWIFIYNNDASDPAHYGQITRLMAGGQPAISGDGSKIVVERGGSIGLYDQQGHELANFTAAGIGTTGTLWKPAISADGHIIALWSSDLSSPGGAGQLFTYDLSSATVRSIASTALDAGNSAASFSADGHYVIYQSDAPGGHSEIYLYDLRAGQVVFQTANPDSSYNPVLSPDGHFIIFASDARLTADDKNAFTDIYVIDVTDPSHPVYKLVSVLDDGTQGDAASNLGAAISAGGQFVAFGSRASNFSTGDGPGSGDIFVVDPTSGHSAIILESRNSPAVLGTSGVVKLTGEHSGVTLGVSDSRLTASFDSHGDIQWSFNEPRSDFASLQPGQLSVLNFVITLGTDRSTTEIPVKVSVYDVDQPAVSVADAAPVASPVTLAAGTEDTSYTITSAALLAGVVDIDGPSLSITAVGIVSGGGAIVDNHDGTFSYTPAPNYNGPVIFSYTASDGTLSASSTATLDIAGVNDAPVAGPVTLAAGTEDSSYTISSAALLAGVVDIDGPSLSITAVSIVSGGGAIVDNHDGTFSYTPAPNYNGPVIFSYTASDGTLSASSTATLNIAGVNDAPVASPVALAAGTEDSSYTITSAALLAGVVDIDGPSLSITAVGILSGGGAIVDNHDGTFSYAPAPNYNGPVIFNYTASDGTLSASSTAILNIASVDDAPVFSGQARGVPSVGAGNPVLIVTNVSASDVDSDNYNGGSLAASVTSGAHFGDTLSLAQRTQFIFLDGSTVMFDPDGTGRSAVAIGTLTLGPALSALTVTLNENAGDAAVAALTQAIQFSTVPANGNASPGTRTVTFTLTDGGHASAQFDTTVDIAVNRAPVAVDDSNSITAGSAAIHGNVLANDSDPEHQALSVSNVAHGMTGPQTVTVEGTYGELVVDKATGEYSYTLVTTMAQADAFRALGDKVSATDAFTYTASDGALGDNAELEITVTGVNDAPALTRAALNVSQGGTVVLGPSNIGVIDPDNASFTFATSAVSHGSFQVTTDGTIWVNATSFTTADLNAGHVRFMHDGSTDAPTFSIQADDGAVTNSLSNVLAGNVTFTIINFAPVIIGVPFPVIEGGTTLFTPAKIGIIDFDSTSFTFTVSNVTHGDFQITTDGNTWVDATTFTSADMAAGHVRFVHDGGEDAPTFSIQADDGATVDNLSNVISASIPFTHVNDAPVIAGPNPVTASVQEDVTQKVVGQLTSTDPDGGAPVWSVVGGTAGHPASYSFKAYELKLTDTTSPGSSFDDTLASLLRDSSTYTVNLGSFSASGGAVLLDSAGAGNFTSDLSTEPFVGQFATRNQTILKSDAFSLDARFGLTVPTDLREGYGIRLNSTDSNTPETLELMVQEGENGSVRVRLRDIDHNANTDTTIGTVGLNGTYAADDQIVLSLAHSASTAGVTASFYIHHSNGTDSAVTTVGNDALFVGSNITMARAQVFAYAPAVADSYINDAYGAFSIGATGAWDYALRNGTSAVQSLGKNDHITETFNVQVADGHGGTDTQTINVMVNGSNDTPTVNAALTAAANEGAAAFTRNLLSGATDADNGETATLSVTGVTYSVDGGAALSIAPAGFSASGKTLSVDPTNAAFDHLAPNQHTTVVVSYNVTDVNGAAVPQTETVTINGVNDAPVIAHASLTVAQGHTVAVTTADIDFVDPDSAVVTYTVSDLGHGHFEIGSGNDAVETETFTSADVVAGLVSFVDDGSSGTPTFSLTPNDGSIDGTPVDGAVTFSAASYMLTSTEGVIINVTPEGATSGFGFPGAGNVTTPGIPEDRIAIGYDAGRDHVVLDNAPLLGVHQMASLSSETHSSGDMTFVSTTLDAGHDVTLVQTLALGDDANFFTTTIDITNNGATDISNLRFLRNFDPDQDVQARGPFETFNDVVQNPDGAETFAIVSATGVKSHTTVAMVGLGAEWRGSVFGFTNTDPYALHAFDDPTIPNSAVAADKSLSLTSSLGTLAAHGGHAEVTYITTNNVATPGSNALYGTAGDDTINGLGGDDLLIGLNGADTFVFNAASGGSGHDTIADFTLGQDKIKLDYHPFDSNGPNDFSSWLRTHATAINNNNDVLIDLNVDGLHPGVETILLKNVVSASLQASDFILHTT